MDSYNVRRVDTELPDRLAALAEAAAAESIAIVSRLIEGWVDGSQRFDRPGERLLVAVTDAGSVIAVGGLSRCPDVANALRVRRFYVSPSWRRRGVARELAEQLIGEGFDNTDTLTCNAGASAAAPVFWEALGFQPVATSGITHTLRR